MIYGTLEHLERYAALSPSLAKGLKFLADTDFTGMGPGKVEIDGRLYEAKSQDRYIDPRCEVEVVGFENFSVIVKKIE